MEAHSKALGFWILAEGLEGLFLLFSMASARISAWISACHSPLRAPLLSWGFRS